jgi:hypothetical protein
MCTVLGVPGVGMLPIIEALLSWNVWYLFYIRTPYRMEQGGLCRDLVTALLKHCLLRRSLYPSKGGGRNIIVVIGKGTYCHKSASMPR